MVRWISPSTPTRNGKKEGKCHMDKKKYLIIPLICILLFCAACGTNDMPPDSSLPEPDPHDGVFTSEYGTMTFNGDGESITFDFTPELAEATGLPGGDRAGPMYSCSNTNSGAMIRRSASGLLLRTNLLISSTILL